MVDIAAMDGHTEAELLTPMGALEAHSDHPLARVGRAISFLAKRQAGGRREPRTGGVAGPGSAQLRACPPPVAY